MHRFPRNVILPSTFGSSGPVVSFSPSTSSTETVSRLPPRSSPTLASFQTAVRNYRTFPLFPRTMPSSLWVPEKIPRRSSHHPGPFSLSLSNGSGGCGGKLQPTLFAGSLLLPFRIMRPSYSSSNLFHAASVLFLLVPVRARAIYTNRVSFVVVLTAGQFIVVCCTLADAVSLLSSHRRISRHDFSFSRFSF